MSREDIIAVKVGSRNGTILQTLDRLKCFAVWSCAIDGFFVMCDRDEEEENSNNIKTYTCIHR